MKWTTEDAAALHELQVRQMQFYDKYLRAVNDVVLRNRIVEAAPSDIAKKLADNATAIRAALKPFDGSAS
mgnify:CR=1 FL=1